MMILSCVILISTATQAHDGMFALFNDQSNHDCDQSSLIGVVDTIYLFYVHGNGPKLGHACELRLRFSSPQLIFAGVDYSERIEGSLIMGDIMNGVAFASMECLGEEYHGSPAIEYVYLAAIRIANIGDTDTCSVRIMEHPESGGPRMTICDPDNTIHNAFGDTFVFNGLCTPELILAILSDPLQIEVTFDEAVTDTSSENSTNYEIFETGNEANAVPVTNAALQGNQQTVILTAGDTLSPATDWTVRANNIKDLAGNLILPSSEIEVLFLNIDLTADMLTTPMEFNTCCYECFFTIHFEVTNEGTLPADSFRVSLRYSSDPIIDVSDSLIDSNVYPGLVSAASVVDSFQATLPSYAPQGNRYFGIYADDLEWVNEYFRNNNTVYTAVSYNVPYINSIADIGEDQGNQVRINFLRSPRDVEGSPTPVFEYEAYRWDGSWILAGSVPAHGESEYNMVVSTLVDSTESHGIQWSQFVVHALTAAPETYFVSCPDSGYSVDNIAPVVPTGFSIAYNETNGNELTWDPCEEDDFDHYKIYRSETEDFTPSPTSLVQTTAETVWTDDIEEGWRYYYKISAVDDAGNESDAAAVGAMTGTDMPDAPKTFALYQNIPNPFNPVTSIRFDLPVTSYVRLTVFDVTGRCVRTLTDENMPAGSWTKMWDGRDAAGHTVASGIYFYRLETASFTESRKMILLR